MTSLAGYFKNDELSDIDLVLRLTPEHSRDGTESDGEPASKRARGSSSTDSTAVQELLQLAVLPGHKLILFISGYFKAQVGSTAWEGLWRISDSSCQAALWQTATVHIVQTQLYSIIKVYSETSLLLPM
jgi:hypothetical protein